MLSAPTPPVQVHLVTETCAIGVADADQARYLVARDKVWELENEMDFMLPLDNSFKTYDYLWLHSATAYRA
jgi:hypothetical protein